MTVHYSTYPAPPNQSVNTTFHPPNTENVTVYQTFKDSNGQLTGKKIYECTAPKSDHTPSKSKWKQITACAVGIILGGGMIAFIGGFGIAGVLQNSGLAHLPQWLVNPINTVSHTALQAMIGVGSIAGVITIAISSYFLHQLRKSEKEDLAVKGATLGNQSDLDALVDPLDLNADDVTEKFQRAIVEDARLLDTNNTYIWTAYKDNTYDVAYQDNSGHLFATRKVGINKATYTQLISHLKDNLRFTESPSQTRYK